VKTLHEYVIEAEAKKVAIGHFNISNMEGAWAVSRAAKNLNVPVIIGVSEGERDFLGVAQTRAIVSSIQKELDHPIFLNADHTYSLDRVKEAVDAGFDSVIIDGAKLNAEENLKITKEAVQYAKSKNINILVEGELGYIGQSSKILDAIPEGVFTDVDSLTSAQNAAEFVKETGIDMLAPAVGNIHGMLKGGVDPNLNIKRIAEIRAATGIPLVLHGGSGNSAEDFVQAIEMGIAIVHINTELRVAFRDALKKELQDNPDEVAPYKIMKSPLLAMQKLVEDKLKLFNKL
jgi:fructose-bisphosphate aldolase class II